MEGACIAYWVADLDRHVVGMGSVGSYSYALGALGLGAHR